MRYFVDTEFLTLPTPSRQMVPNAIIWLSLGIVAEDGRELYLEHRTEFERHERSSFSPFVRELVLPKLSGKGLVSNTQARKRILGFIADAPEFWGDCAAFDYVVLSQIMGSFEGWPAGWPYFFRDIQQMAADFGLTVAAPPDQSQAHHALSDARDLRDAFKMLRREWESKLPDLDPDEDDSESPSWRFDEPEHPIREGVKEWAAALTTQDRPLLTNVRRIFPRTIDGVPELPLGPFTWGWSPKIEDADESL